MTDAAITTASLATIGAARRQAHRRQGPPDWVGVAPAVVAGRTAALLGARADGNRSAGRTRTINRLRWHLHQLDPDLEHAARSLSGPSLDQIAAWLAGAPWSVQVVICQELTATVAALTAR